MAGLEAADDESRIEAELKRCQELENMVADQKSKLRELDSRSIEDFESTLQTEHKFLLKEKTELSNKLVTKKETVEDERKVVAERLSKNREIEEMEVDNLKSYLKGISLKTPIFRDALTAYNKENLTKHIDQIRLYGRRVKDEIAVVDRTIEELNSKYDLDVEGSAKIPGEKSRFDELRDTMAILIESKSEIVWRRKSNQFLNGQLEKNSARKKREIASFQSTK